MTLLPEFRQQLHFAAGLRILGAQYVAGIVPDGVAHVDVHRAAGHSTRLGVNDKVYVSVLARA